MQENERIAKVLSYESTKHNWSLNHSSTEWREASELNNDLYGMPLCTTCPHVLNDLFSLLHHRVKKYSIIQYKSQKTVSMSTEKKFVLKGNKVITSHHFSHPLDKNSSDEDFIKLLRINKKHINKFEKFPGDWEKIVEASEAEAQKKAEAKKKASTALAKTTGKEVSKMTTPELEAFATENKIDISKATNNKQRVELINEALSKKKPEQTDDEKADARYAERQSLLVNAGWDATDDIVFRKGELTLQKGDVWAQTDEEFQASLPTE